MILNPALNNALVAGDTATPLTVEAIADGVWDELRPDHDIDNTTGRYLEDIRVAALNAMALSA